MLDEPKAGRLQPLKTYVVSEEANRIKTLANNEGVSVSHYLRQKLKRLLPLDVCANNINEPDEDA